MDEMTHPNCPHCGRRDGQLKIGHNASGSQRYLCKLCQRKYTPAPHPIGYAAEVRQQAIQLYVDGINFRRIGRVLRVSHQTVANWVAAHARTLPETPPPPPPAAAGSSPPTIAVGELDELYTFEGAKKTGSTSSLR